MRESIGRKRLWNLWAAGFLGLLVTSCGPEIPPLNFSAPNVQVAQRKLNAEVKSITVAFARPDEQTGEIIPSAGPHITALWRDSIQEAFDRMAIFKDDAPKKISVSVKILKIHFPTFGSFTSTWETAARYEIIDRGNGSLISSSDVNATGSVPPDYAFFGLTRVREALNRAVQNNILQFLQQLQMVDADKFGFSKKPPTLNNVQ